MVTLQSPEITFWPDRMQARLQELECVGLRCEIWQQYLDLGTYCQRRVYVRLLIWCTWQRWRPPSPKKQTMAEEAENRRCSRNSWSGFCDCTCGLVLYISFTGAALSCCLPEARPLSPISANDRPSAVFFFYLIPASNEPHDALQRTAKNLMTTQKAAAAKLSLLYLQLRPFNKTVSVYKFNHVQ